MGEHTPGATSGTSRRAIAPAFGPNEPWSLLTVPEWEAFWIKGAGAAISKEKGVKGEILTLPVGSFPSGASPYGALDMAGNAAEWVQDWYNPNYYRTASVSDPQRPGTWCH